MTSRSLTAQPRNSKRRAKGTLPDFTPVPRRNDRHDGWTPERQRAFIEALADLGSVAAACRTVGMSEVGAYQLRRHPEAHAFRKAWKAALALGVQRIEDVAMDRALNGVEVPVYAYGNIIGTRRSYNDRLLMFMLRNRAPKRFTAGGAKGMNALDQTRLKRLRKQWHEEWEAERTKNSASAATVRASIERKVAALRAQITRETSPAAVDRQIAAIAQRRADTAAGWHSGEPYAAYADKAAELLPGFIEEVRAEFPERDEPPLLEDRSWEDGEEPDSPSA